MKSLKRVAVVGALGVGMLGLSYLPAPEAAALRPKCDEQREGTFDTVNMTCSGVKADCTETTVCG